MSPEDKAKYEAIYQENRDMRGEIACKPATLRVFPANFNPTDL